MTQKKHRRQASSQSGFPHGSGFPTSISTGVGVNLPGLNGLSSNPNPGPSHYRTISGNGNILSFPPFPKSGLSMNRPTTGSSGASSPIDPSEELDKIAREILVKSDGLKPLNEKVLRRHNPEVGKVLHIVPYAVVYSFSTSSQSWEKCNIEGSLFVVGLLDASDDAFNGDRGRQDEKGRNVGLSIKRFAVMILNRRSLENFCIELNDPHDVDVTAEYIMLQGVNSLHKDPTVSISTSNTVGTTNDGSPTTSKIYGLWIFSEVQAAEDDDSIVSVTPVTARSAAESSSSILRKTAAIVQRCAIEAEQSRMAMAARAASVTAQTPTLEAFSNHNSIPHSPNDAPSLVRQLSLRDLFGEQRAQDSGWTMRGQPPKEEASAPQFPQGRDPSLQVEGTQSMEFSQFMQNDGLPPGLVNRQSPDNPSGMGFGGPGIGHRFPFPSGPMGPMHGIPQQLGFGTPDPFGPMGFPNPPAVPGRYPSMTPPYMQQQMPPGFLPMGMPPMQGYPQMGLPGGMAAGLPPQRFGPVGNQNPQQGQHDQYIAQQYGYPSYQDGRAPNGSIPPGPAQNNHLIGLFGASHISGPATRNPSTGTPNPPMNVFGGNLQSVTAPSAQLGLPPTAAAQSNGLSHLSPSAFFQMAASGQQQQARPQQQVNAQAPSTNMGSSLNTTTGSSAAGGPGGLGHQSDGLLALFGPSVGGGKK